MTNRPYILLASYPKSGNTWARIVFDCIQRGTPDLRINELPNGYYGAGLRRLFDSYAPAPAADLHMSEIDDLLPLVFRAHARTLDGPVVIKTHAQPRGSTGEPLFPPDHVRMAIHLVRHPFDVAVSFANHLGHSIDETIAVMMKNGIDSVSKNRLYYKLHEHIGSWQAHSSSWAVDAPYPVLTIRYEDLVQNPVREFGRIMDACKVEYQPQLLREVVQATRFDRLKASELDTGFAERPRTAGRFFDHGGTGRGYKLLNRAQKEQFRSCANAMARFNYDLD